MALWELINPSDAYTFETDDFCVACMAAVLLSAAYGAKEIGGEGRSAGPWLFCGNERIKEWFADEFEADFDALFAARLPAIAACLESFVLGNAADRESYDLAIQLIESQEGKAKFRAKHQERHSSMNDIGRAAASLAAGLRKTIAEEAATAKS